MMPGLPVEGSSRLQLELIIENVGSTPQSIGPEAFYLLADDGQTWSPLLGGTFRNDTIQVHQVLDTVVAFDLRDQDTEDSFLYFVWRHDGGETRFAVDAVLNHEE